jgi:hypothetical protein
MFAIVLPARSHVSSDEEDKEEDEESGHDDDEDVDDINHVTLTKDVVRANSPDRRSQRVEIWNHVRPIGDHDLTDHVMKTDYTYVCVYRLSDPDGGEKRYFNKSLKLFRSTKGKETGGRTRGGRTRNDIGCVLRRTR